MDDDRRENNPPRNDDTPRVVPAHEDKLPPRAPGNRRRFIQTGTGLLVGGALAYAAPKVSIAAGGSSLSPMTADFVGVMQSIGQNYDEFVAVTLPLMATLELTPPDPTLIPGMAADAQSASLAAQDAVNEFNALSASDKSSLLDQAREALEEADRAQRDVQTKKGTLEALLNGLPAIPTTEQEQEVLEAIGALRAANIVLNATADALATVITALGSAVADVVTAIGNGVVDGVNLVGKLVNLIGKLFK